MDVFDFCNVGERILGGAVYLLGCQYGSSRFQFLDHRGGILTHNIIIELNGIWIDAYRERRRVETHEDIVVVAHLIGTGYRGSSRGAEP